MPLYEYLCDACGHQFERIQKYSDPLVETCPVCGAAVHKLVSSPAFHLKGSGWYATDYAKKGDSSKGKEGPAGESSDKGGSETKEPAKETTSKEGAAKEPSAKESTAKESTAKESTPKTSKTNET